MSTIDTSDPLQILDVAAKKDVNEDHNHGHDNFEIFHGKEAGEIEDYGL